jgi:hypothetical protein
VKLAGHATRLAKYKPVTGKILMKEQISWNDHRDFLPARPCIYERLRSKQKN